MLKGAQQLRTGGTRNAESAKLQGAARRPVSPVNSPTEKSITFHFDWEKDSLKTSADFDRSIEGELYRTYMDCNWYYDLKESDLEELKRNGVLSWYNVIDLLNASLQTERRLSRFCWVAGCVIHGDTLPPREKMQGMCETIYIDPTMATEIRECLMKAYPNLKGCECAKNIGRTIDELAWKLDIEESSISKLALRSITKEASSPRSTSPCLGWNILAEHTGTTITSKTQGGFLI